MKTQKDLSPALNWFNSKGWQAFDFQQQCWNAYLHGKSGLLNAPTGSGKTYAIWLGCVLQALQNPKKAKGLQVVWVTPLRALAKDIHSAMTTSCREMGLDWEIGLRTGDTSQKERQAQETRTSRR